MIRESFEREMKQSPKYSQGLFIRNGDGEYSTNALQAAWLGYEMGWQASRAVALEDAAKVCEGALNNNLYTAQAAGIAHEAKNECTTAIRQLKGE